MCRAWPSFRPAPEPGTFGGSLHTTDVEPTLIHPPPNTRKPMIPMCRNWPSFRLAPEPATFGSFLHTTDVEPTLLHPSPNTRKPTISMCREWPSSPPTKFWHRPDKILAPPRQNLGTAPTKFRHRPDKILVPPRQNLGTAPTKCLQGCPTNASANRVRASQASAPRGR